MQSTFALCAIYGLLLVVKVLGVSQHDSARPACHSDPDHQVSTAVQPCSRATIVNSIHAILGCLFKMQSAAAVLGYTVTCPAVAASSSACPKSRADVRGCQLPNIPLVMSRVSLRNTHTHTGRGIHRRQNTASGYQPRSGGVVAMAIFGRAKRCISSCTAIKATTFQACFHAIKCLALRYGNQSSNPRSNTRSNHTVATPHPSCVECTPVRVASVMASVRC